MEQKQIEHRKSKVKPIQSKLPVIKSLQKASTVTIDNFNEMFSMDIKNLSKIPTNNVCDNHCFLIICRLHQRIMLRKNFVFFPCLPLNPMKTWLESSIEGALSLLIGQDEAKLSQMKRDFPFKKFVCMDIFRFQLPHTQHFITRLIYLVEVDPFYQNIRCCSSNDNHHFRWYPLQDAIQRKINKIWGPEVSYYTNMALATLASYQPIVSTVTEYSLNDAFKYIPRESPVTPEEQMLDKTNVTVNDIERLYADFIEHCFPSFFFTRFSFENYMQKHQIEINATIITRYYAAFRFREKQYMQFHELLLGLASIDSRAPHEEFRIKLIFRYYDYNNDKYLSQQEFERLLKDIEPEKSSKIKPEKVKNLMKKIGTIFIHHEEMIPYNLFQQAIIKGLIRGTNKLCRSMVSPFGQITRSLATRKLCTTVSNKNLKKICLNRQYKGKCNNCKKKSYILSSELIFLDCKGVMNIQKTISYNSISSSSNVKKSPKEIRLDKNVLLYFILSEIHKFNKEKNNPRNLKKDLGLFSNLSKKEIQLFAEDLKMICMEVSKILEKEDRVLKIFDPCYVVGDIHGNLEDLITMEQCLWKTFPLLTSNYLFLGDYVDRGRWGFECFLYLMIAKYLAPKRIFLLRGNHEIECIQIKYSFHKEMIKKYGNNYGQQFFDLINEVFNRLPFSAVINESIYCAHGGLPYSKQNLETLNKEIPKIVQDPETEALPLWEIVWSDPLEYGKFGENAEILGIPINYLNGFFLPNVKRGTSFFFNEFAVIAFFKENNLNYMIRAHEVPAPGYKFNFGTLCTTIFSCSHYCGNDNECAVALVDRESRIRVIRIDTSMNLPAT